MSKYLEVIVDIKANYANRRYTYLNGFDQDVAIGERIKVPFGKKGTMRKAFVVGFSDELPEGVDEGNLKVASEREGLVCLNSEALSTATWLSYQTVSRLVDCLRLFVPSFVAKRSTRKKQTTEDSSKPLIPDDIKLTDEQQIAFEMMRVDERPTLLHGVAASGKTEIYLMLAKETISQGRQVIMLVPEIALTGQMIGRFQEQFEEDKIAILHSRRKNSERKEDWHRIYNGEVDVVIGPMSAVFSPTPNLGLIIVDEEHENSYKSEQQPRYETGEVAIKRGSFAGAKVVLGSATPSIERYYKAKQGEYQLIEIKDRYGSLPPHIDVVDMREELRQGRRSVLSLTLRTAISTALEQNKQVILFINRRGYARSVVCRSCGETIMCENCNIPMTYHHKGNFLLCHQCEQKQVNPTVCPNCGSKLIKYFSPGTEKVKEEVEKFFGEYKIARLDSDVMSEGVDAVELLEQFRRGEIDILLGTQMVSKGLDFRNVALMGIVAIDYEINYPDFRAAERGFAHIVQASGRAGRRKERGRVVVQTYQPECDSVFYGVRNDYSGFYEREIERRRLLKYPPFSTFVEVDVRTQNLRYINDGVEDVDRRISEVLDPGTKMFSKERVLKNPPINNVKKLLYKVEPDLIPRFTYFLTDMKAKMAEDSLPYWIVVDTSPK